MASLRAVSRPLLRSASFSSSSSARTLFTRAQTHRSPVLMGIYATAILLGSGLFAVYYFDPRAAIHRYVEMPVLRQLLDPEVAHKLAVKVLRSGLGPKDKIPDDESLTFELWGRKVLNPVGIAAGFDKDGEAVDGLFDLGFSWVEIGSVAPKPQPGNPRPRVFRLPLDKAMINRYGFPSQGHVSVLSRLRSRIPAFFSSEPEGASLRDGSLLAVNLGKNKESPVDSVDDYVKGITAFGPYSDVLVVNVSSPNTPGLRGLQSKDQLEKLLSGVTQARDSLPLTPLSGKKPRLVLKIAPDLNESQLEEMAGVIRTSGIDGVIVSNTTVQRPDGLTSPNKTETGGLSGPPLKPLSLAAIRTLRSHLPPEIVLIGCGGITSGSDALEYAQAGASMVQLYTGFGYDGVGSCRRIKDQIVEQLKGSGDTWASLVQKAVAEKSWKKPAAEEKQGTRGESSVQQLIREAEDLQKMLNKLGEGLLSVPDPVMPTPAS